MCSLSDLSGWVGLGGRDQLTLWFIGQCRFKRARLLDCSRSWPHDGAKDLSAPRLRRPPVWGIWELGRVPRHLAPVAASGVQPRRDHPGGGSSPVMVPTLPLWMCSPLSVSVNCTRSPMERREAVTGLELHVISRDLARLPPHVAQLGVQVVHVASWSIHFRSRHWREGPSGDHQSHLQPAPRIRVAQVLSFSWAAETLGVSRSALSQTIRKLERGAGVRLSTGRPATSPSRTPATLCCAGCSCLYGSWNSGREALPPGKTEARGDQAGQGEAGATFRTANKCRLDNVQP